MLPDFSNFQTVYIDKDNKITKTHIINRKISNEKHIQHAVIHTGILNAGYISNSIPTTTSQATDKEGSFV